MGFFAHLFRKAEDPDTNYSDPVLGPLEWSEDDEAWLGDFNSLRFSLAYDGAPRASEQVVAYAREFLADPQWLAASLAEAKKGAKDEYAPFYDPEIDALSFGRIHFHLYKHKRRIFAELEGGRDFRAWRIEFADRHCEGIGFDS